MEAEVSSDSTLQPTIDHIIANSSNNNNQSDASDDDWLDFEDESFSLSDLEKYEAEHGNKGLPLSVYFALAKIKTKELAGNAYNHICNHKAAYLGAAAMAALLTYHFCL